LATSPQSAMLFTAAKCGLPHLCSRYRHARRMHERMRLHSHIMKAEARPSTAINSPQQQAASVAGIVTKRESDRTLTDEAFLCHFNYCIPSEITRELVYPATK